MDNIANLMSNMLNAEKIGKKECTLKPSSIIMRKVLDIMKMNGYIEGHEEIEDGKGGIIKVILTGKINGCGVVKPRFSVKKNGFEKFEKRYLPAKGFGYLIVSTPKGIMSQKDAAKQGLGGRLLCYVY